MNLKILFISNIIFNQFYGLFEHQIKTSKL